MKALVIYASKYGSTKGIAEFISEKLRQKGLLTEVQPVEAVHDVGDYDVLVIGSAVYMGHWLKEATEFVKRSREILVNRQVWLFSSGPLAIKDAGVQSRARPVPKEIAELSELIHPRDHQVFFGVLDGSKLSSAQRMMRVLPAAQALLPEGDFRDWNEIEAWVVVIMENLQ